MNEKENTLALPKIGYQGIRGSNSERATDFFISKIPNGHYLTKEGLITSECVVRALLNREIYYGVMAIENNLVGKVEETRIALGCFDFIWEDSIRVEILNSICSREDILLKDVKHIASHPSALAQCGGWIKNNLSGNVQLIPELDTSLSAMNLSLGLYPKNTIAICPPRAIDLHNLKTLCHNVTPGSYTTFVLFRKNDMHEHPLLTVKI